MSKTDENKADSSTLTPEELGSVFDITGWLEREGKAEGWYGNKECVSLQLHDTARIFIAAHNGYTVGIMDRYSTDANTLFPPFPDFPSALAASRKFIQLHKEVIL